MRVPFRIAWLVVLAWIAYGAGSICASAFGCPFCSATSQTLRQDIASMDVVGFGKLVSTQTAEINGMADFELTELLRGNEIKQKGAIASAPYYGPGKSDSSFLLMGVGAKDTLWSSALKITSEGESYLRDISKMSEESGDRLRFYIKYLQHPESLLSRDAYEEFAQTPYAEVKKIADAISHDDLVTWIKDSTVSPDRKRLYYTLLGIVGEPDDTMLLEQLMHVESEMGKPGLDALIACYLTLKGESGLPKIEDLFLKNRKSAYGDTYAAVMALRFHGTEGGIIDRDKILASMRWMLERPEFADLVIPDLARWEDWSQIDRLVTLFKDADDSSSWVRVPVVNYLRACPLPIAREKLVELEAIDPKAVKRASTFFPIPQPSAKPSKPEANDASRIEPNKIEQTTIVQSTSIESFQDTAPIIHLPLGARGYQLASSKSQVLFDVPTTEASDEPSRLNPFGLWIVISSACVLMGLAMWGTLGLHQDLE